MRLAWRPRASVLVLPAVVWAFAVLLSPAFCEDRHELDLLPHDASQEEWLSEADAIMRAKLTTPKVRIQPLRATPFELSFRFETVEVPNDGKLRIPLVVPRGEITSTVLTRLELDGVATTETTALRLVNATTRELGYLRVFRIAVVQLDFEPRRFGPRTVTGGSVTVTFSPPAAFRDPNALKFWARNRVGIFRDIVTKLVANPMDVDRYIVVPEQAIPRGIEPCAEVPSEIARSPFRLRIRVRDSGLYRISGADLESSGIVVSWLKPEHVRLFCDGQEVPMLLVRPTAGEGSALQPDDVFLFYGRQTSSPFSAWNVYWLIYDEQRQRTEVRTSPALPSDLPCESAAAFTARTLVERDTKLLTRNDQFLSILSYRWVWDELPTSGTFSTSFDLPHFVASGRNIPAVLHLFVHALAPTTSATVALRLNDGPPLRFAIANEHDERKPFTIPERDLRERANRLEAWLEIGDPAAQAHPGQSSASAKSAEIYLDNLELWYARRYACDRLPDEVCSPYAEEATSTHALCYRISVPRSSSPIFVWDVTEQTTPSLVPSRFEKSTAPEEEILAFRVLEPRRRTYCLASLDTARPAPLEPAESHAIDLRTTSTQADYLIIAHPDFLDLMRSFVARKQAQGHRVLLVDTQTVYDQFSHGQETPEAIKRFIDYAARHYDGTGLAPPASYVLLVGDATSAYKNEFRNNVINYVPSYTMRTAPDSPEQWASDHWYTRIFGTDDLSDVLLGRLSVNNRKDLESILAKLETYEKQRRNGADWRSRIGFVADHTEFDAPVARVIEKVPPSYSVSRLSLTEEPWEDNFYFPKELAESKKAKVSPEMTRKIRDLFNGGTALVWYFGHGSPNIWSTQRIWFGGDSENSDNLMLRNRDRLAIVLNMTCNSGAIDYPMPRWNICISEDFMRVLNGGAVACYVPSGPGMVALHEKLSFELVRSLLGYRLEPLGAALTLAAANYLAEGQAPELVRMFVLLGDPSMETALLARGGMFSEGLGRPEDLRLISSRVATDTPCQSPTSATIHLVVENTSSKPIRDAVFVARSVTNSFQSAPACFFPREKREISIPVLISSGVSRLSLNVRCYGSNRPIGLGSEPWLDVVGGGGDAFRALQVVDSSLEIQHTALPGGFAAEIAFDVANVGSEPLKNVVAWLETPTGMRISESQTSVALVPCGSRQRLIARRSWRSVPEEERLRLRVIGQLGSKGTEIGTMREVAIGKAAMPDLTIPPGGILPHKSSVSDGETVFFTVVVENRGRSIARNVRVDAYDGTTTNAPPLQSRVPRSSEQIDIAPNSRRLLKLRWDPFENAGEHELLFRVWSASNALESRTDNNQRTLRLKVLTKYQLRPLGLSILPQNEEDRREQRLRFAVRIENRGETPAHGVRVVVYGDRRSRNRAEVLAEDFLQEIPAQTTVEHVLTYRLAPSDVGRRFEPWFEVFLKGSAQRVPWPE